MKQRRNTIIVGTGFRNSNGIPRAGLIRRYCRNGAKIILKREPTNPHDSNAIGVYLLARVAWVFKTEVQIGYIDRTLAKRLAPIMDDGTEIASTVASFWAPDDLEHPRVSITIAY